VSFLNTAATVVNSGTVQSGANPAVYLQVGGAVFNVARGVIAGGNNGVVLNNGGVLVNAASAQISGYFGVAIGGTASTGAVVNNKGIITGNRGIVIDRADTAPQMIVNYGTISGT